MLATPALHECVHNLREAHYRDVYHLPVLFTDPDIYGPYQARVSDRTERLWNVLTNRVLIASLVYIAPAAMVKSSFEGILPLFADGRGFDEFEVPAGLCNAQRVHHQ